MPTLDDRAHALLNAIPVEIFADENTGLAQMIIETTKRHLAGAMRDARTYTMIIRIGETKLRLSGERESLRFAYDAMRAASVAAEAITFLVDGKEWSGLAMFSTTFLG